MIINLAFKDSNELSDCFVAKALLAMTMKDFFRILLIDEK